MTILNKKIPVNFNKLENNIHNRLNIILNNELDQ